MNQLHLFGARPRRSRGQALVLVTTLLALMLIVGVTLLRAVNVGRSYSVRSGEAVRAQNVADAGLDFAMATLNATISSDVGAEVGAMPVFFYTLDGKVWRYNDAANGDYFARTFAGIVPDLQVEVPSFIPVPNGIGASGDYRIIRSVATAAGARRAVRGIAIVDHNLLHDVLPTFAHAVLTQTDLVAGGAQSSLRTDSYDSRLGAYGGTNVHSFGNVHSNGSIVGQATFFGKVSAAGTIDLRARVEGLDNTLTAPSDPKPLPSVPPFPPATATPVWHAGDTLRPGPQDVWNLGDLVIDGNRQLTLGPGTYRLNSLTISGNGLLTVLGGGTTDIVVAGPISVSGNGISSASRVPPDLRLVAAVPGQPLLLAGNGAFYGTVLAPANPITIGGNGTLFGAVVGGSVTFNGSNCAMHYDESLGSLFMQTVVKEHHKAFRLLAVDMPNARQ